MNVKLAPLVVFLGQDDSRKLGVGISKVFRKKSYTSF